MTYDLRTLTGKPEIVDGTMTREPETAGMSPAEHAAWRQRQHERKARQQQDRELSTLKAHYRKRFMRTPGASADEFEEAWPDLLDEHRRAVARGEDPLSEGEPVNPHADPRKWGL